MTRSGIAGIVGAAFFALLALSGCEGEGGGPPLPGQPMSTGPRSCPRIYNPVCGARGSDQRSFPNSCEAAASGYDILYGGQCQSGGTPGGSYGGGQGGPYGSPGQGGGQGSGQMCPMIYKPVCGRRGGETRTFPNACQADNAGFQVLYESECLGNGGASGNGASGSGGASGNGATGQSGAGGPAGGDLASQQPGGGQTCSRAFVPVCGKKGSETKTFINACMAQSKGYRVASQGRCQ